MTVHSCIVHFLLVENDDHLGGNLCHSTRGIGSDVLVRQLLRGRSLLGHEPGSKYSSFNVLVRIHLCTREEVFTALIAPLVLVMINV